ncbi:hypothetical protein LTR95_008947 [Oleoguttula sp. CCFEE 5521]
MASQGQFWWFTPLQSFAVIGTAINFGGSALQSPLIMPMLQLPQIPVQHAGTATAYLLHNSEKFFPPLNGACTLSNLILTITAYVNRDSSVVAAAKLPYALAGFALNMATTAWALGIMVPMNKAMTKHAETLERDSTDEKAAKELRRLQKRWQGLNYGRAAIMLAASITSLYGLLQDGAVVRL